MKKLELKQIIKKIIKEIKESDVNELKKELEKFVEDYEDGGRFHDDTTFGSNDYKFIIKNPNELQFKMLTKGVMYTFSSKSNRMSVVAQSRMKHIANNFKFDMKVKNPKEIIFLKK